MKLDGANIPIWRKVVQALLAVVLVCGLSPQALSSSQVAYADEPAGVAPLTLGTNAVLEDGTYEASKVTTDVTTASSGMIMVTKAIVVIKDGQATAIVTMKGTGADRLYVSDTATADTIIEEAVAEEAKEVGGQFSALIGPYTKEGESAYTFWPVPITLGQPKVYAARSESHFKKWDLPRDKYFYVHDFQIDEADLTKVSDSTDIMSPEIDAQVLIDQFYVNNGISSDHASVIKAKGTNVTVPYYEGESVIKSFKFKTPDVNKFVWGWFVDSSIFNTQLFTSANLKKVRYPYGASGGVNKVVTFQPKDREAEALKSFTATLKLYPAGTGYNAYDATGVYYDAAPLAEKTFTITLQEKPQIDFNISVAAADQKTGEDIANPVFTVTDETDNSEVAPNADGTFKLNALRKYTVAASAEGYLAQGGAAQATKTGFSPSKEGEVVQLKLLKEEDASHTLTFSFVDQFDEAVVNPSVKVTIYGTSNEVAANADGSYTLWDSESYRYTATAEGYEDASGYLKLTADAAEAVKMNKYLSEYTVRYKITDKETNETLDGVTLVLTNNTDGGTIPQNADGTFTVPAEKSITCVASKENYQDEDFTTYTQGFEPTIDYSFSLAHSYKWQLADEIAAAKDYADNIVEADEPGKWATGTTDTLNQAIAAAQAVHDDPNATEGDYQEALKTLKAAEKAAADAQNWFESNVTVRVNKTPGGVAELYKFTATGEASKTYKYSEPATVGKQVSFIDVLAGVHEQIYGDAYKAAPKDYFDSQYVGFYFIKTLFEKGNYYQFALNGESTGNYQSCIVNDGDVVDVSLFQKTSDIFLPFSPLEMTAKTGTQIAPTLTQGVGTKKAAEGYVVTLANENGTEVQGTVDTDGKVALTFAEPGTYTVTAAAKEGATAEPVLPYLSVDVAQKTYNYWMQVRGMAPIDENTYSLHGTGEVVTLYLPDGTSKVIDPPTGTYYVLSELLAGQTYTVTVDAPEGYTLVTNREWSVPDHGYVNETDGSTQWTTTFTVPDQDNTHLGNLLPYFVKTPEQVDVDWTAVDAALENVPGNMDLFTDSTAVALNDAVAAVDREETNQEIVDEMAANIESALTKLVPKDGVYEIYAVNANGAPNYIYEGAKQTNKNNILVKLVVRDGVMTNDAQIAGGKTRVSYNYAYVGTKDDATAAASADGSITIGLPGADFDGDTYNDGTVELPVPALYTPIAYAYHSASKASLGEGWYDQNLTYNAKNIRALDAEDDGITALTIYDEELMFKVVNAYIEKTDSGADFVFALSAKGYEYVYAGTYDEAMADLDAVKAAYPNAATSGNLVYYAPATVECVYDTSSGTQNDGTAEKYQFRLPITDADALAAIEAGTGTFRLPITAISNTRAKAGNWDSALTARQALVDLDAAHVRTGNYRDEIDATVTSELETMLVEPAGKINTIGTPQANEYACQPTFTLADATYDAAFVGTPEAAAAATKTIAPTDGTFVIPLANSLGKAPQIDIATGQAKVAFHVAESADFDQAGTWVERTITVDPQAGTIVLSGDELTKTEELGELEVVHVGNPRWVAGQSADITAQATNLAEGETVVKWAWEYSKNGQSWKKSGAKSFADDAECTLYIPECTQARKAPMAWRVTATTSLGRTATTEGQSLEEVKKLEVVKSGAATWVEGADAWVTAKVEGLATGEKVASYQWYYSKDNTNWKKTGAKAEFDETSGEFKISGFTCTNARKAPMAWCVKITTTEERSATSEGINLE